MLLFFLEKVLNSSEFYGKVIYVELYSERGLDHDGEKGENADKQAQHNCALFSCQEKKCIFFKAYSTRFCTGGIRLFALSCERRKNFFTLDLLPGQSSKQEVICVE